MSTTIRQSILSAIATRLADITAAKGYNTAAGASVHTARHSLDDDDCPCVVLWPQAEEVENEYGVSTHNMPVEAELIQEYGSSEPSAISEQALGDLIECMTAPQWSIAFTSGGTYEIQPGDTITGATSGKTALVQSVTLSTETWVGGDAAGTLVVRRRSGKFSAENLNVGANTNVATITATATVSNPETTVCGGYADSIEYVGGGTEEYPERDNPVVGSRARFMIQYRTIQGNPYLQPGSDPS